MLAGLWTLRLPWMGREMGTTRTRTRTTRMKVSVPIPSMSLANSNRCLDFIDNSARDNDAETLTWCRYNQPEDEDEDNETSAARLLALANHYHRSVRARPPPRVEEPHLVTHLEQNVQWPSSKDWGLWRIKCWVGSALEMNSPKSLQFLLAQYRGRGYNFTASNSR